MIERREGPSQSLFPIQPEVAQQSRGAIRYMYRERHDLLNPHLHKVSRYLPSSDSLERLVNSGYDSQPHKSLATWYALGLTMGFDVLVFQSRRSKVAQHGVSKSDVIAYNPIREHIVPEDLYTFPTEEIEVLSDRLRRLLIATDDSLHLLTDAMREFYLDRSGQVSSYADMAYLSGIADTYIPFRYAHDRVRMENESDESY